MNANGPNQTQLNSVTGYYSTPSYSPDGSKIIFIHGIDITIQVSAFINPTFYLKISKNSILQARRKTVSKKMRLSQTSLILVANIAPK